MQKKAVPQRCLRDKNQHRAGTPYHCRMSGFCSLGTHHHTIIIFIFWGMIPYIMLLITGITEADRRERVRELANITVKSYTDNKLDKKILNADEIVQSLYQGADTTRNVITVSNLYAARLILTGIAQDGKYDAQITALKEMAEKIIEADNDIAPEQTRATMMTSTPSTLGTFR